MPSAIYEHLGTRQFSRLIYGAIVGLGLIVALEYEEPGAAVMAGTLVGTGIAIGLAELYSEFLGTEVAARRRVDRAHFREMAANVAAIIFGASFPALFFVLAAVGPWRSIPPSTGSPRHASVVRNSRRRSCRPLWSPSSEASSSR
jgi:hypothetical protein